VAAALAGELGWAAARAAAEVERFAEEARAEGIVVGDVEPVPPRQPGGG
jgi:hypothetical protein